MESLLKLLLDVLLFGFPGLVHLVLEIGNESLLLLFLAAAKTLHHPALAQWRMFSTEHRRKAGRSRSAITKPSSSVIPQLNQ
eukprot:308493-Amphidinium_carterae.1